MADGIQPSYDAAGQGRRLKFWPASRLGPNATHASSICMVQARSRERVRNDGWASVAITKSVSNAIGTGIQCKPLYGTAEFQASFRRAFKRWTRVADAYGVLDWYGLQGLAWREWREAGEVFVRIRHRLRRDGLPVPLQIQLIESEQCPPNHYAIAPNGNAIKAGIELDAIGRRVAYWMYKEHPGDIHPKASMNWGALVRVPAEQILHIYRPIRAGALRGVPDLSPVLVELFKLDKLGDAVLFRQQIANLFAGWYVRKSGADPENEESALSDLHAGDDDDGTPIAGLEPGTMQELPDGVEPKFSSPPGPGDTYAEFVRHGLMRIAAAVGVPYEVMTGDLRDVSDRSLRLILNEFRRLIEQDQWLYFIPQFLQGVTEQWTDAAVLDGVLPLDNGEYEAHRDDIRALLWVPEGWPYSHPVQDVDADNKAIRSGLTSRSKVVMKNGYDSEEIDREQADDNLRADKLGLPYDSDCRKPVKSGQGTAQPDESTTNDREDRSNA